MALALEQLAKAPSPESWRLLCEALAAMPEGDAGDAIAKIEKTLDELWDDKLRATMCGMDWDDRFFAGSPDPRSRIVRFLRFDRIFTGRYVGGIRMRGYRLGADHMRRLASSSGVQSLTDIDFGGHDLGPAGVSSLAEGTHFTSLRSLTLDGCAVRREALNALVKAPFFLQLRVLSLCSNRIDGGDLEPLLGVAGSLALEELDLASNPLGREGATALAKLKIPTLAKLGLYGCSLGPSGAERLAAYAGGPVALSLATNDLGNDGLLALVSGTLVPVDLSLSSNAIGAAGVRALCDSDATRHRTPRLVSLDLSDNVVDDDAAHALAASGPETLRELQLDDNDLTGLGLAALLGSPRLTLRSLRVEGNRIGAEGMRHLGRTMGTLETLHLGENRIGDEGIEHLAGAQAHQLRVLSLSRNAITAPALETLTGAPWFGNLTTLDVSQNALGPAAGLLLGARFVDDLNLASTGLGDEGAVALASAEFRPKTLDLGACDLTDRGLSALAESPVLSRVETLRLSSNHITDRGILALVRSSYTGALRVLHVSRNRVSDEGARALATWQGPLAFFTDGNPFGVDGKAALAALPARCCP